MKAQKQAQHAWNIEKSMRASTGCSREVCAWSHSGHMVLTSLEHALFQVHVLRG